MTVTSLKSGLYKQTIDGQSQYAVVIYAYSLTDYLTKSVIMPIEVAQLVTDYRLN